MNQSTGEAVRSRPRRLMVAIAALAIAMLASLLPVAAPASVLAAGNTTPQVGFAATPRSGPAPLAVMFTTVARTAIVGVTWSFGDGIASTSASPAHTYARPGTYDVAMTVTFADATTATITRPGFIVAGTEPQPGDPSAAFTVGGAVHIAGRPVPFRADAAGESLSYAWDFGDGGTAVEPHPTHTFAAAGSYTVTLVVADTSTDVATDTNAGQTWTSSTQVVVLPAWTGTYNLYRSGAFSTQQSWVWCVPASAQIMVNLVTGSSNHTASQQRAWYNLGRQLGRYQYSWPGVDPQGEAGILNAAGVGPYAVYAGTDEQATLRYAVKRMRLTGKPVGLFVGNGFHAWVLNGFSATADPALTDWFTVTAVYVMGPLYPKQIRRYGYYDLPPNSRLTNRQLASVLTGYRDRRRTIWDRRFVVTVP